MGRYLPVAFLTLGFALQLGSSVARAECDDTQSEFDDVYCYAKVYIESDNDLNDAYKAITSGLDTDAKSVLKKSQRAWMQKRNEECSQTDSDGYYVDLSCAVDFTRNRTQFLRDRAAECEGGQCDLARMSEVD
jgi:uncharacterized protein YecT (DUF1311 family)